MNERGSTVPLIIGFMVVLLMAGVVVINASAAWMHRQSLNNAAEGAALYAADLAAQGAEVYRQGLGSDLVLSPAVARRSVAEYLNRSDIRANLPGVVAHVWVTGDRVRVRLRSRVELPISIPGGPTMPWVSGQGAAQTSVDP